ncbi:MAG: DUF2953 domain-containing protein [Lachnospirales bacterium]
MAIFLLVLKILLFIILALLAIILLLLLVVLFSNFTYTIEGKKDTHNFALKEAKASVDIHWFCNALKFHFLYDNGSVNSFIKIFFYKINFKDKNKKPKEKKKKKKKQVQSKKVKKKKKKKNPVSYLLKDKYFIKKVFTTVKNLLNRILPNYLYINGELGLDNPATTGQIVGAVWAYNGAKNKNIYLKGNFEEKVAKGEININGNFTLWQLLKEFFWAFKYIIKNRKKLFN